MRICGIALVVVVTGCASESPSPQPQPQARSRVDLRAAIHADDAFAVGVAVSPDGERFVFDESFGLYRVEGNEAVDVLPTYQLPISEVPVRLPYTDMVWTAPGVFALTAIGDGFLLDTGAMTLTQHFCYLPVGTPPDLIQQTDAIAYDAELDRIYAQPRTYDPSYNLVDSQLAGYVGNSGELMRWQQVGIDIAAGGMAVLPDGSLVLGQGSRLDRYDLSDPQTYSTEPVVDLATLGVSSIQGLAYDPKAGTLLVLDGERDELVEIELE